MASRVFHDIWILSRSFEFSNGRLARATAATFKRRETPIPTALPDALAEAFSKDQQKQRQWRAFVEDVAHNPGDLMDVITDIAAFLMPHAVVAASRGK
ncbi:nucleotidyl transferase AbiEii/AbiGii toxin family protein [Rhizobium sp. CF122]|uniref:nucleotidyl transferase AbiEii/AbiGii toxin family protein n=1 Tax=Rhizobium sp. CF122 TaxID=1144312 RepID=UPI0002E17B81|nr:nucleotidyl transferase AbiEii/AbiGii toxin family protein [Rhizobium sp. CF122]